MANMDAIELERLALQSQLDAKKTAVERNKLGQFATPAALAFDILAYAKSVLDSNTKIQFLDPAFGTGAFYSALQKTFSSAQVETATGYEIDPDVGSEAVKLWRNTPLSLNIADFTQASPPVDDRVRANLLICNPPYVRHHHLPTDAKRRLQKKTKETIGFKLNGLSGFYCYYLCLSHSFLAENGLAGWLIPSEFMDVNYGHAVKRYLLDNVTLLHIHRFDQNKTQFDDALVSSTVVWFRKSPPPEDHAVKFTYGGTLAKPEMSKHILESTLRRSTKWTRFPIAGTSVAATGETQKLSDLFTIKRGLATGANRFFILTGKQVARHDLPPHFFIPILPRPKAIPITNEIKADNNGNPILDEPLFLLSCNLPESQVQAECPALWNYLQKGVEEEIDQRYLSRHRNPWYAQENRPAAPLLCTYMGRQVGKRRPFRFILNHSRATAANVYLMLYPKPALSAAIEDNPYLLKTIWCSLNQLEPETLIGEGRIYGGGLHKIEPNELGNLSVESLLTALPELPTESSFQQLRLLP